MPITPEFAALLTQLATIPVTPARTPLLLVTTSHSTLYQHPDPARPGDPAPHPHLGRLLQPRHYSAATHTSSSGIPWAADNDCFQGLDERAYHRMLAKLAETPAGCRFVTVPDVVADAAATAARFRIWAPIVRGHGLPVAIVLQDGQEHHPIPWDDIDAVFVGGSDTFKLGEPAAELCRDAKARGKWVHWGRVNTRTRIRHCIATGACDSMDGSGWARFRMARDRRGESFLDKGLRWTREALQDAG